MLPPSSSFTFTFLRPSLCQKPPFPPGDRAADAMVATQQAFVFQYITSRKAPFGHTPPLSIPQLVVVFMSCVCGSSMPQAPATPTAFSTPPQQKRQILVAPNVVAASRPRCRLPLPQPCGAHTTAAVQPPCAPTPAAAARGAPAPARTPAPHAPAPAPAPHGRHILPVRCTSSHPPEHNAHGRLPDSPAPAAPADAAA